MVGRRRDGAPLVPPSTKLIAGIGVDRREHEHNGFLYEDDPDGIRCPFGAHIRRANPRTGDLPGGRGSPLAPPAAQAGLQARGASATTWWRRRASTGWCGVGANTAPLCRPRRRCDRVRDEPRGLQFICLVANISRQFEFVQNAWVNNAKFDGLSDETDPLLGNREPLHGGGATDRFSLPRADGPPRRLENVPRFVTVRGGAYFFLPGIRALRYIAEVGA